MNHKHDITISNILTSGAAGVATAFLLGRFGATGTLLGAGLGPIVFLIVKELTRVPADRVTARSVREHPSDATAPHRRSAAAVGAVTGVLATLIAVGVVAMPEFPVGTSPGPDRRAAAVAPTRAAVTHPLASPTPRPNTTRRTPASVKTKDEARSGAAEAIPTTSTTVPTAPTASTSPAATPPATQPTSTTDTQPPASIAPPDPTPAQSTSTTPVASPTTTAPISEPPPAA